VEGIVLPPTLRPLSTSLVPVRGFGVEWGPIRGRWVRAT
jgi:hypothetical protein